MWGGLYEVSSDAVPQEQPLLIEELLEQEKQEQLKQQHAQQQGQEEDRPLTSPLLPSPGQCTFEPHTEGFGAVACEENVEQRK